MSTENHPARYAGTAKALHWTLATIILVDFLLGVSFGRFDPGDLLYLPSAYGLHMTVGMCALVVGVACIVRRATHAYPLPVESIGRLGRAVAQAAHRLLYCFMLVVPLTGWAVLSVRKRPAALFGSLHWPNIGFLAALSHPLRSALHDFLLPTHIWLAYLGMCLVAVHALAALYHHFYLRDEVLTRMLPQLRSEPAFRADRNHGA